MEAEIRDGDRRGGRRELPERCRGVKVRRILLANPLKPLPGNRPLVAALQRHAKTCSART